MQIEVNGQPMTAHEGETILQTLRRGNIDVPTLCYMEDLSPTGACRICVVEVEGQKALVPSCAYPVADGMKIQTHSPRVLRARKTIVELLLANHPDDCLYCIRNGSCQLQELAEELGVRQRRYAGVKSKRKWLDVSSPSVMRDPAKCILCGRCVRVCEEVQSVGCIDFTKRGSEAIVSTAFEQGLNVSTCVNCGRCIQVCPTGALREQSSMKEVFEAISHPEMTVVVQHAPAVSITLGEEFGLKKGADVVGLMTSAFRMLGVDYVFETSFSADLTIMEEGSELVRRIQTGGPLPMFTSCSPGWVKFVEQYYPEFLPNVSTCKSPQQMMGALVKTFFAQRQELDPSKIFSVAVMPCTAKKFEAGRREMGRDGLADVDAVLTTRELARMIRMRGIQLDQLQADTADTPFGERSTAGKMFAASGGVMEAALRSGYFLLTGEEMPDLKIEAVRGLEGVKTAAISIGDLELRVAVVSGLGNARALLEEIKAGRQDFHFVEVMTCPGGCINGGGQPYQTDLNAVRARARALYRLDRDEKLRCSHKNPSIQRIYKEFLGEPLGEKSHELLHTEYVARQID